MTMILGLVAGMLTTIAFIPQVVKTWKTKSADDLSLGMYVAFCLGVSLWLIYGFIVSDLPIIAANLVTLSLAITLLYFKLTYNNKTR
ncbi:MtN3 and saliva related transmembrane protein [Fodinibius sediminis]|uniref:MtN3 and saliva related transmembrane protein n=2 Tax=Fodinibius sediminis TaxID=1214077 RepID=A0A521DG81_9BACT|nr:MtN3 and saliva related transmembrane protein [Fodinibius sediminis]